MDHLNNIFTLICSTLKGASSAEKTGTINPKGDASRGFDLMSENAIRKYCEENLDHPICLMSEESGEVVSRQGQCMERWVIDPVDGSENYSRGLDPSGLSIAVLPYDAPVTSLNVKKAITGDLSACYAYTAKQGCGAFDTAGKQIHVSGTTEIDRALIGCDLNFKSRKTDKKILELADTCMDLRRMGSSVCELMYVADGRYDAYVDMRNELTAEDFLAASLIIREAGGVITDINGNDWGEITDLTRPFTVIAAATPELHKTLIEILKPC